MTDRKESGSLTEGADAPGERREEQEFPSGREGVGSLLILGFQHRAGYTSQLCAAGD